MNTRAGQSQNGNHLSRRAPFSYAPFLVATVLCLAGLVATYGYFVKSTNGQYIDESALDEASVARMYIGMQTAQILDYLPIFSVIIAAIVVLFVTLARKRWKAAGIAVVAMGAANLSTQLLKVALPDRPDLGVHTLALNSLPSGHSTMAASAAAAVFLVVSPRWRPVAAVMGAAYAVFAGLSTLINQWHRPADVLAAFFVVAIWTLLAAPLVLRSGKKWNVWLGQGHHWASSGIWASLAALVAVGAALATMLNLNTIMNKPAASTYSFFLAGVGEIVAVGFGLAVAGILFMTFQARRREIQPRSSASRYGSTPPAAR